MEFPPDLYPQQADVTREEILRQIFGDVGELHYGTITSLRMDLEYPNPPWAPMINEGFLASYVFLSTSNNTHIPLILF